MADIAAHTSELERRRDDVEKLTIQLQASETQAYELRETLSSEIHRRLDEISRLTRELSAVYGSISWRATQPIRTVVRRIIGR
jgi:hypothetical protein